jgi:hypothetical protein
VDAPISAGNSGGPLINLQGEVVAMSTLGSVSAGAQNLNFGISVDDIRAKIADASGQSLVELPKGVGLIDMDDERPESGEIIAREPVPSNALESYAREGREMYADLLKDLRRESSKEDETLKLMRRGETFIPAEVGPDAEVAHGFRGRLEVYYFRNSTVKNREVNRQQMRVKELDRLKETLSKTPDNDSLFALLKSFGPRLDPRRANRVGFLSDARAVHPYNEHDVMIDYDDAPYLLWVPSTAGLSFGTDVTPAPVYVAGTETLEVPDRGSMAVTVLISLTDAELRKAIYGSEEATPATPAPGAVAGGSKDAFRTWTDKSGQYKIDAQCIDCDDNQVVLKTRDGKVVTVPLVKLSDSDVEFLKSKK